MQEEGRSGEKSRAARLPAIIGQPTANGASHASKPIRRPIHTKRHRQCTDATRAVTPIGSAIDAAIGRFRRPRRLVCWRAPSGAPCAKDPRRRPASAGCETATFGG
jgi:hypothetical protein